MAMKISLNLALITLVGLIIAVMATMTSGMRVRTAAATIEKRDHKGRIQEILKKRFEEMSLARRSGRKNESGMERKKKDGGLTALLLIVVFVAISAVVTVLVAGRVCNG